MLGMQILAAARPAEVLLGSNHRVQRANAERKSSPVAHTRFVGLHAEHCTVMLHIYVCSQSVEVAIQPLNNNNLLVRWSGTGLASRPEEGELC